jgi:hypothetical protein
LERFLRRLSLQSPPVRTFQQLVCQECFESQPQRDHQQQGRYREQA